MALDLVAYLADDTRQARVLRLTHFGNLADTGSFFNKWSTIVFVLSFSLCTRSDVNNFQCKGITFRIILY